MAMEIGESRVLTFRITRAFGPKDGQYGPFWSLICMIGDGEFDMLMNGYADKDYGFWKDQQVTALLERVKDFRDRPQFKVKSGKWAFGDTLDDASPPVDTSKGQSAAAPAKGGVSEDDFLALVGKLGEVDATLGTILATVRKVEEMLTVITAQEVFSDGESKATVERVAEEGKGKDDADDVPF